MDPEALQGERERESKSRKLAFPSVEEKSYRFGLRVGETIE